MNQDELTHREYVHELPTDEDAFQEIPTQPARMPVVGQIAMALLVLGGAFFATYAGTVTTLLSFHKSDAEAVVTTPVMETNIVPKPEINAFADTIVTAQSAYVWDMREQQSFFNKDADRVVPLASVTKLMTALVAYEILEDETTVPITMEALMVEGDDGLIDGEVFTLKNITDLMLLASSNDGATALAIAAGKKLGLPGDPISLFIEAMNTRAKELGLHDTIFYNVTGLDLDMHQAGAYGTAREMALLMEYLIQNYPEVISVSTLDASIIKNTSGAYHQVKNTNEIVGDIPGLIGSKTGFTDLAGGNLVVAFDVSFNHPIIVSVLGSTRSGRFEDVKKLVDKARAQSLASLQL